MKSKLLLFYSMFLNSYYYYQHYDEETSKRYAYTAVRNFIGVVIFMSSIVVLSVTTCVLKLKISILKGPMFFVIVGLFLYFYLLLTRKFLKPLFSNIELKKAPVKKNYYFEITVVLAALFGGGMYVLGRLLTIYLCG